jgi:hypothetical protein
LAERARSAAGLAGSSGRRGTHGSEYAELDELGGHPVASEGQELCLCGLSERGMRRGSGLEEEESAVWSGLAGTGQGPTCGARGAGGLCSLSPLSKHICACISRPPARSHAGRSPLARSAPARFWSRRSPSGEPANTVAAPLCCQQPAAARRDLPAPATEERQQGRQRNGTVKGKERARDRRLALH